MKLIQYLSHLGYGSRREVQALFAEQRVTTADGRPLDPLASFYHEAVRIDGECLDIAPGQVIMLHKPVAYVCSTQDAGRLIYDLLPPRFRHRSPLISPIGRLDRDTSGLLLLTDDGQLNHRITSPRRHLPKIYEVGLAADLRGDEGGRFASGSLLLETETTPLAAAALEVMGPRMARLTLTEGRYHQVRRMFAAVGNHVETLHRVAIGGLVLDPLASAQWRLLTAPELERLR